MSSLAYRFASTGTSASTVLFLFALALMCVPSMKTASVDRYPAFAISVRTHVNTRFRRVFSESVAEIVADRGEVRRLVAQAVAEGPAVGDVDLDLRGGPTERRQTVQMLKQYHFEQDDQVDARSTHVLAVAVVDQVIEVVEVHRRVDLAQEVGLRHEHIKPHDLGCVPLQHLFPFQYASFPSFCFPYPILPHFVEKSNPFGGLFRQAD